VLAVEELSLGYGAQPVLRQVCCKFGAAEAVALIGRNGSGKSTLAKALTSRLQPEGGRIFFNDQELPHEAPWIRARRGIVGTFQDPHGPENLSLVEALSLTRSLANRAEALSGDAQWGGDLLKDFLKFLDKGSLERPMSALSFGQRKLANLALVTSLNPRVLVLDEPVGGLAPAVAAAVGGLVRAFIKRGALVILIEHDFEFLASVCGRFLLLAEGGIVLDGSPDDVLGSSQLMRVLA